jgi:hypothetical protein
VTNLNQQPLIRSSVLEDSNSSEKVNDTDNGNTEHIQRLKSLGLVDEDIQVK